MLACILFVFGALVEYAVILFRRQTSKDDEAPVSFKHCIPTNRSTVAQMAERVTRIRGLTERSAVRIPALDPMRPCF